MSTSPTRIEPCPPLQQEVSHVHLSMVSEPYPPLKKFEETSGSTSLYIRWKGDLIKTIYDLELRGRIIESLRDCRSRTSQTDGPTPT